MNEKSERNWWEFYGVRYAQGTVVGAMIIFFLFSQNEILKKLLFIPERPEDFGIPHLILLTVYGLAYCYISSAPILVMHAGRGLLYKSKTNVNPWKGYRLRVLIFIGLAVFIFGAGFCLSDDILSLAQMLSGLVMFTLFMMQVSILYSVFISSWEETFDYYALIVKKRNQEGAGGYVESYKHIREHGNSFLIVVFQFFLALPIFLFVSQVGSTGGDAIRNLVIIIIIWIIPAATIWFFGNKLENNLQYFEDADKR